MDLLAEIFLAEAKGLLNQFVLSFQGSIFVSHGGNFGLETGGLQQQPLVLLSHLIYGGVMRNRLYLLLPNQLAAPTRAVGQHKGEVDFQS
jgi:hypothetical protein